MPEKPKMVTTLDNPWNPFKNFDEWYAFDTQKGYNTCSYLARVVESSPEMSYEEGVRATNRAVDEIVKRNLLGIYKTVVDDG